jgi:hypothetical protein
LDVIRNERNLEASQSFDRLAEASIETKQTLTCVYGCNRAFHNDHG